MTSPSLTITLVGDTLQIRTAHGHIHALSDSPFVAIHELKRALRHAATTAAKPQEATAAAPELFAYVLAEWEKADKHAGCGKVLKRPISHPRLPDGIQIAARVRKFAEGARGQDTREALPSLAELGLPLD